ncbi:MAG: methionyl-tRNA formyltransferase [Oscillospiraceae bacterium]|nr:methionyl-tRNA formyltransferase [Oscillospiraceae bacterium]
MNIVFMGSPDFAVPCLKALIDSGETVQAVLTQPDKARGRRGNKLMPTPVKELALQHDIPVYQPVSLKKGDEGEQICSLLEQLAPELIVVVAYGKILPKRVLDIPKHGCINVHASLLPRYRGAAPIQWCVLNGERETGVTTMLMAEGLDTGDMLLKSRTEIGSSETASELHDRLSEMGARLLLDTVQAVRDNSLHPEKQDDSLSNYAPMLTKDMCPLDFSMTAEQVHHKICGLSAAPCATAYIGDRRLKLYRSELSDITSDMAVGSVVKDKYFTVVCGDGKCIRIIEVQADGGKRMNAADFLRGNRIEAGTVLTGEPV